MQAFPRFGARSSRLRRRSTMSLDHLIRRRRRRTSTTRSARKDQPKKVKINYGATRWAWLWKTRKPLLVLGFPRSARELRCSSHGVDDCRTSVAFQRAIGHEMRPRGAWRATHSARFDDPQKNFEKNPKKFPKIAPNDRIFEKSCRLGTGLGSWVRVSTTDLFAPTTLILVAY
ncbi:MAG: hypothetical protein EBS70_04360 [Actinobacteria bacterium]|nr:hypothetical protein [Actinomycetota bacterium]